MQRFLVAVAFSLAACAPAPDAASPPLVKEKAPVNNAVPAPTPPGVTQRLTVADDGRTIAVPISGRFAIELVGVPTAGYLWGVATKPAFLSDAVETSGNTTRAQSQPGFTGGNHWEVFTFQATAAGEGKLKLEQRRPWEKTEPASKTFTVTIQAR